MGTELNVWDSRTESEFGGRFPVPITKCVVADEHFVNCSFAYVLHRQMKSVKSVITVMSMTPISMVEVEDAQMAQTPLCQA